MSKSPRITRISAIFLFLSILVAGALLAPSADAVKGPVHFKLRFDQNARGNFVTLGNTVITCPANASGCALARQRKGKRVINNEYNMKYVDVDSDSGTFNSSAATLSLPAGAEVLHAALYWMGNAYPGQGTTGKKAPNPNQWNRVRFATPATGYQVLTADREYWMGQVQANPNNSRLHFAAVKDVTNEVRRAGNGSYRVANVQTATGDFAYGGWGMIVFYEDENEPIRNMTLHDGFVQLGGNNNPSEQMTISGFMTPPTGTVTGNIGVIATDGDMEDGNAKPGDPVKDGDRVRLAGQLVSDKVNPANDFFNSTISSLGSYVRTKSPKQTNAFGIDVDRVRVNGLIPPGSSSVQMAFTTRPQKKEFYRPVAMALAFDLQAPEVPLTKTQEDINGDELEPGDEIRYTVRAQSFGPDHATNVVLRDAIPENTTYVPGSLEIVNGANAGPKTDAAGDDQAEFDADANEVVFRLGVGADATNGGQINVGQESTIAFTVRVDDDVPGGTLIRNISSAAFNGSLSPDEPYSSESNEVVMPVAVNGLDLAIDKQITAPLRRGQQGLFQIVVTNVSEYPSTGTTTVTDQVPGYLPVQSVSGPGWDCSDSTGQNVSCTRSDTVDPGDAYPPISVVVLVSQDAPDLISNTAFLTNPDDQNPFNNEDTVEALLESEADVAITKDVNRQSVRHGQRVRFTLDVVNNGPSAAKNVTVRDRLPRGLKLIDVRTTRGSCAKAQLVFCELGTLGVGQSAKITIIAKVRNSFSGRRIENVGVVESDTPDSDPTNNEDEAEAVVPPSADLAIRKDLITTTSLERLPADGKKLRQISKAKSKKDLRVQVGSKVLFLLTVRNNGPATAEGVRVRDKLPEGLKLIDVRGTQLNCEADKKGNSFVCRKQQMEPGEVRYVLVVAEVQRDGEIVNVARVGARTHDPDPSNNRDREPVGPVLRQGTGSPAGGGEARGPGGSLPFTGLPLLPALIVAALLVALGLSPRLRAKLRG